MPAKNVIKIYAPDSYYHIYNRGVDKRNIFEDKQDYNTFLKFLKQYLLPPNPPKPNSPLQGLSLQITPRSNKNYHDKISLIAYCLMPNHFHLLIHQKNHDSINFFMRSLATKYVGYFNKKYFRIGHLFQGTYKAPLVDKEEYLLYLTKYIHLNPVKITDDLIDYPSSLKYFLSTKHPAWIYPETILSYFSSNFKNSYNDFVFSDKYDINLPQSITID